jgi:hypothetical protein
MTVCSAGDRPRGWEGLYIYSLFARNYSFINMRSLMLSFGGQGMLSNAIYLCWIIQVLSRGTVVAILYKGVLSIVVFKISPSYIKTFYYTP